MDKSLFKKLKIIVVVFFIILVVIIAVYRFPNRNITMHIETNKMTREVYLSSNYINQEDRLRIELSSIDGEVIEKIKLYGSIQTICIRVINGSEFFNYIDSISEGEFIWTQSGTQLVTTGSFIELYLNEKGKEVMKDTSQSFLLERFLLMEVALIICIISYIVLTIMQERKYPEGRNNHSAISEVKRFFRDIISYKNYMIYAAKTDLKAEVANSYLNRLWWLLEPLFNMLVYVVVFGGIMGASIENYATFVFSSLLMWNFFSKTVNYSVKLVRNNKDIITKVYVPKFVILASNMFLNLFKLMFSMIVLLIMLIVFRVQIRLEVLMVVPAYVNLILLAFGVGMLLLHHGVYVDDLSYAVSILLSMLMFLSGIFYDVLTTLSEPLNIMMLSFNPVAMMVDTMRNALIYGEITNVPLIIIWFLISLLLCCIGVHIVYKNENSYVKVV